MFFWKILQDLYDGFINIYHCEKLWQFKKFENILILKYSCFERFDFDMHPVRALQHSNSGMFASVCSWEKIYTFHLPKQYVKHYLNAIMQKIILVNRSKTENLWVQYHLDSNHPCLLWSVRLVLWQNFTETLIEAYLYRRRCFLDKSESLWGGQQTIPDIAQFSI